MRSMTGFGSATRTEQGLTVTAEIRTLNNRFLKVGVKTPGTLSAREHKLEALVRERIVRGTATLSIRLDRAERPVRVRLNEAAVREYGLLLEKLKETSGATGEATVELLSRMPGVFEAEEIDSTVSEEDWETVRQTTVDAIEALVVMREREGANLRADFVARRDRVEELVSRIEALAPDVAQACLDRLSDRVEKLLARRGVELAEGEFLRELGILAERSDVAEEMTRLRSHLEQYAAALESEEEIGRRLEFLLQEMFRETNTIAAKSADVTVSEICVDLKVELDRLKEQVQNVE